MFILAIGLEYCCLWLNLHNIVILACSQYKTKTSGVFSLIYSMNLKSSKSGMTALFSSDQSHFRCAAAAGMRGRHHAAHAVRRGPLGRWGAFTKRAVPSDVSEE